jgi:polysaccharide biosynthesis protein PelF
LNRKIKVMLATEGTYPFHLGGVSTWCDILIKNLPSIDYVIYSVLMDPFVSQKFTLENQAKIIRMPLWGTEEPSEHLSEPFSKVYLAKLRTDEKTVREHFLPLFREFISEIVREDKNPIRFGKVMLEMYFYFQVYDYKNTFKAECVWEYYKSYILHYTSIPSNHMPQPDIFGMIQSLSWLYRFFNILNTPIPKVQVAHSSAAAFCGIPCVIAKMKDKTPFLLTEHGVYLREQYISLSNRGYSSFLNKFLMGLIHSITNINYVMADQISPVCSYNTRWEKFLGVPEERIKVIHNGVDKTLFTSGANLMSVNPTVISVARIDPYKDILTLIRSAGIVKQAIPSVRFIVYGSVAVPEYYEECLRLRQDLGLEETFIFAGHTNNIAAAYQSGDVIAVSSITEAFPYAVVEAMMSAKPVVSTNVGGIKEALGPTGILVKPSDPDEFAKGILKLLTNPGLREEMGRDQQRRALRLFTLNRVLEQHLKSYILLALGAEDEDVSEREDTASKALIEEGSPTLKRQVHVTRGYALLAIEEWEMAIEQFCWAITIQPSAPSTPVLLMEIMAACERQGKQGAVDEILKKYNLPLDLLGNLETVA